MVSKATPPTPEAGEAIRCGTRLVAKITAGSRWKVPLNPVVGVLGLSAISGTILTVVDSTPFAGIVYIDLAHFTEHSSIGGGEFLTTCVAKHFLLGFKDCCL